jgi:UDP-glucuronate 4-epimerase
MPRELVRNNKRAWNPEENICSKTKFLIYLKHISTKFSMKKVAITGAAGFIGSTLADYLLHRGDIVLAIDNFNTHYDPQVKRDNIRHALADAHYTLYEDDIRDSSRMAEILKLEKPDTIVHVAGYTGMNTSLTNVETYFSNNGGGTCSMLEAARAANICHFIFISTGTVYGENLLPASEEQPLPPPCNPYVATKMLGEKFVKAYEELFDINFTILRLYTVYGPRQRPEMAIAKFTKLIDTGKQIPIYGDGSALRDYLYIENCIEGLVKAIDCRFKFEIMNIGQQQAVSLSVVVQLLSRFLKKPAHIHYIPTPNGIPERTLADISKAKRLIGYQPKFTFEEGLAKFVQWYQTEKKI